MALSYLALAVPSVAECFQPGTSASFKILALTDCLGML
jgi:hypothetical protein